MTEAKMVKVAAVQYHVSADVAFNLQTALRMLDKAAEGRPDLVVLPEFANHLSWYENKEHCYQVSVPLDGPWLAAIAEKARQHRMYVVVNVTLQRAGSAATGTSLLYGRDGKLVSESDKQVLMGHENDFLAKSTRVCPIVETEIGRIGLYACMDGVINETPRGLGVSGAQILCNSLNSFALDEASLHIPVRAPENRVFIVAANKVGPLIPEMLLEPVSQATSIPVQFLSGAGESQVVAPDGRVLAMAPREGEAVIYAEIDPTQADVKLRPDGTDVFKSRRPSLYKPLAEKPPAQRDYTLGAAEALAGVFQPSVLGEAAIEQAVQAVRDAAKSGVQLLTLPEMFCFENGVTSDPESAVIRSQQAIYALTQACREGGDIVVVTSLVTKEHSGLYHTGVAINKVGILLAQGQLHRSERHAWSKLVDTTKIEPLPWARLGLVVGDDALYPETFRLVALQNAEVVAVPFTLLERWEVETGLLERSAENRVCVVAATRATCMGASLITTLWEDFTVMTPWKVRPFDGHISYPIVTRASSAAGLTLAPIHPRNAHNKFVSKSTNVLDGRPWQLLDAITRA
jgi:predicted amidohydrolase